MTSHIWMRCLPFMILRWIPAPGLASSFRSAAYETPKFGRCIIMCLAQKSCQLCLHVLICPFLAFLSNGLITLSDSRVSLIMRDQEWLNVQRSLLDHRKFQSTDQLINRGTTRLYLRVCR